MGYNMAMAGGTMADGTCGKTIFDDLSFYLHVLPDMIDFRSILIK